MRCEEIRPLIESYLDGEVTESKATLVARHLAGCTACAHVQKQFESEQNFYLQHESDLDVRGEFWSDVFETAAARKRLHAQGPTAVRQRLRRFSAGDMRTMRFGPLAAAALVLLTVGITTGIMKYSSSSLTQPDQGSVSRSSEPGASPTRSVSDRGAEGDPPKKNQPAVAQGSSPRQEMPEGHFVAIPKVRRATARRHSPEDLVRVAEQKYIAAIAMLSRDSNRRRQQLDPEARAQLEQTLAVIDRAIASTRQAVHASPGDPVAVQFMLSAYSKKVDVLRQMVDD